MRRLLAVLCLAGGLFAQEDTVLKAFEAGDAAALRALAEKDDPDPWLVAEKLCSSGRTAAALAFARASTRPAVEALGAHVEACTQRAEMLQAARKRATEAMSMLQAGRVDEALALVPGDSSSAYELRVRIACATALAERGSTADAEACFVATSIAAEALGWSLGASYSSYGAGSVAVDAARAYDHSMRAVEIARRGGHGHLIGKAVGNAANASYRLGRFEEARRLGGESLEAARATGSKSVVANALMTVGSACERLGDYEEAQARHLECLSVSRELHDEQMVAMAYINLANVANGCGNSEGALAHARAALSISERLGDAENTVSLLTAMTIAHETRGEYGEALECCVRASKLFDSPSVTSVTRAYALTARALVYSAMDDGRALVDLREAERLFEEAGAGADVAGVRGNLGTAAFRLGEWAEAEAAWLRSLRTSREAGQRMSVFTALRNLGVLKLRLGQGGLALAYFEEALANAGTPGELALALLGKAESLTDLGRNEEAATAATSAVERARDSGEPAEQIVVLESLARMEVGRGELSKALAHAHEAVALLPLLGTRLGEEQTAQVRARWSGAYVEGLSAALACNDPEEAWYFLEAGRAAGLLARLGTGSARVVPEEIRRTEAAARLSLAQAASRFDRAVACGQRDAVRVQRQELSTKRAELLDAVERVRAEQVGTLDTKPALADECRGRLRPGRCLVLYGMTRTDALALTLRADGTRLVRLGVRTDVEEACAALTCEVAGEDPGTAVARLRALLIDPLGLTDKDTRLVVSPAGVLSYVPFVLLAGRREVAYVPSATTLDRLLRVADARGEGVLALGDPTVPGTVALPAARLEARAVGDEIVVGDEATVEGLLARLAQRPRWHAVHLACHATVDREHPTLCALLLAPAGEEDGQLRCLDLFGRAIPADLVVLSACETAKGRVYDGEGIIGFTRAFMAAGASRVLVSLWKVDDEATRALMTKFYEAWKPGRLGAAAALRAAQDHVRAQEKWRHPCYWAAWQLWGLPD